MSASERWPDSQLGLTAEELSDKIHTMTAIQLITQLEEPDCSAGVLQCALRFLKDNDVTALPIPKSALERLTKKLDLPFPRLTDAGTKAETPRSED